MDKEKKISLAELQKHIIKQNAEELPVIYQITQVKQDIKKDATRLNYIEVEKYNSAFNAVKFYKPICRNIDPDVKQF